MRPVTLPVGVTLEDVFRSLREIENASHLYDVFEVSDSFGVGTFTPTFSLDPATATATDVAHFVATFVDVLHRRGVNRRE